MCASGGRLLREVLCCGPLESLRLLNHLLRLCSLSRYCSQGGLPGTRQTTPRTTESFGSDLTGVGNPSVQQFARYLC